MKNLSLILLAAIGMTVITSCDAINSEEVVNELTEAALNYLITSDPVFSFDGLTDEGFQDEDAGVTSAAIGSITALQKTAVDTLWPREYARIRSRRQITDADISFTLDEIGVDTSYATVTGTLSGTLTIAGFNIDSSGSLTMIDSIVKSFTLITERHVRFVATGSVEDSSNGWKVDALTALSGTIGSKVTIENIEITDLSGTVLSLTDDELMTTYFKRDDLASLREHGSLQMFLTISNAGPEFPVGPSEVVGLHRAGKHGNMKYSVHRNLNDRGHTPDVAAEDNIYSGNLTVGNRSSTNRPFRMFATVMDVSSILVPSEELHQAFVGVPYRIAAAQ